MKPAFIYLLLLMTSANLFGQGTDSRLPKEWDKSFVISLSHTGSMSGGSSHLRLTYDSCTYVISSLHDKPEEKRFALTNADRMKILKKMQDLKVDNIKAGFSIAPQNDGWSTSLCLGWHCIEGGSASEMTEKDKNIFLDAVRYLEEFADNR